VREFARNNSEQAFTTLVSRHVNLVYSVALRQVADSHLAQDVTQGVFIILAKKAKTLGPKTIVSAWLCRTARYVSSHALRTQRRRQVREHEAHMQSITNETGADAWNHIAPILDEALGSLNKPEHDAVVLRFFEGKPFAEVSVAIGTSEDAARVRVSRAVEKLRRFFSKRGVTISATVLTGVVAANSVQAAPAFLVNAATASALNGTAGSTAVTTLVQSTMKTMTWLKMKLAMSVGIATLIVVGGVMAVSKPNIHDEQGERMLIVPHQSVGPVRKGMTTNEVEAVLGKPDKWAGKMMVYDQQYGMSVAQSEQGVVAVLCGDRTLNSPGVDKFNGHTKEGIGMKSSKEDLLHTLIGPTSYLDIARQGTRMLRMDYSNLGLTFELESNKVIHILVSFKDKK
jgi:RNA polymerase sigma factor (sigma-70 family)